MTVSFSTATVDPRSQLSYWREVVCATFTWLDVELLQPPSVGFRAQVTAQSLGGMRVATVVSEPHAVIRSPAMIRSAPDDDIFVNMPVSGTALVAQDGREAMLRPGDFAFYDSARPCRIACDNPFRLVVLKIPRELFISRCHPAKDASAAAIRGDRGVGALFSALLSSLPANIRGLQERAAEQVGGSVLELLTTSLSEHGTGLRPPLPRDAQMIRAQQYMSDHLSDPDLSPTVVAAALGLSVRYLHALFQTESTSPFRWILEQRLELAAGLLIQASQASRSVTDIAFGVGFKDTSHFSRVFKERYGSSPRDYRQLRLPDGPRQT